MPRLAPVDSKRLSPSVKIAFERHLQEYGGGVTGIKAILGYSLPAFEGYMYWYPLFEEAGQILGKGLAAAYACAVCEASDCGAYASFFRETARENGISTENRGTDGFQKTLFDFGTAVVKYKGHIVDHLYNPVAAKYNEQEMVVLVAFAGLMSAVCLFCNTLEVEGPASLTLLKPLTQV